MERISEGGFLESLSSKIPWVGSGNETGAGPLMGKLLLEESVDAGKYSCELHFENVHRPASSDFENQSETKKSISSMFWGTEDRDVNHRALFIKEIGCHSRTMEAVHCDRVRPDRCMQHLLVKEYKTYRKEAGASTSHGACMDVANFLDAMYSVCEPLWLGSYLSHTDCIAKSMLLLQMNLHGAYFLSIDPSLMGDDTVCSAGADANMSLTVSPANQVPAGLSPQSDDLSEVPSSSAQVNIELKSCNAQNCGHESTTSVFSTSLQNQWGVLLVLPIVVEAEATFVIAREHECVQRRQQEAQNLVPKSVGEVIAHLDIESQGQASGHSTSEPAGARGKPGRPKKGEKEGTGRINRLATHIPTFGTTIAQRGFVGLPKGCLFQTHGGGREVTRWAEKSCRYDGQPSFLDLVVFDVRLVEKQQGASADLAPVGAVTAGRVLIHEQPKKVSV
jgi:hypothetical protein